MNAPFVQLLGAFGLKPSDSDEISLALADAGRNLVVI